MTVGCLREDKPRTQGKSCGFFAKLKRLFAPKARVTASTNRKPTLLLGYEIGATLGKGSFSVVRAGTCPQTGQKVAIKIIDLSATALDQPLSPTKMKQSLEREIALLASLSAKAHPNVLKYIKHAYFDNSLCIVTEVVEGIELFSHVQAEIRLKEPEARPIFAQLVAGVAFLHENGVVHRDLKLENIMLVPLESGWQVKILDFGLARAVLPGELVSTRCGSEEYAAPEVIRGLGHDPRASDVWSLGVILYAMIVGVLPFNSEPGGRRVLFRAICSGVVEFPPILALSYEIKGLIGGMLQIDPSKRLSIDQILESEWMQGTM